MFTNPSTLLALKFDKMTVFSTNRMIQYQPVDDLVLCHDW
ncbi:hypothetical protein EJK55_1542 [Moraxella catarrhalis]|uniref:Uncharacterized protein n=1 Tax=Moraxella catarrhalis TaxID=480 RepID=A0ABY0BJ06_MORCA|nr:hypothetical protein EJK50_1684 [Moraxella catarrhalis]RUO13209.1 hypothetical protein EJK55_1542 [Moraxella catarrhalis]RUO15592.1 hypothetical protein EJK54_1422 [Moraxella catarrhalis]